MTGEHNNINQKADDLLQEIFNTWSQINTDDNGLEHRYPASRKEINKTKKLLKKLHALDVNDSNLNESIGNIEEIITTAESNLPKYKENVITALIFSLIGIIALGFLVSINTYEYPEIKYNPDWFVTVKSTDLVWKPNSDKEEQGDIISKVRIPKGTTLKPIAQIGNYWFQVETSDGQRGFIPYTLLKGGEKVKAKKTAWTFKKIGGDIIDTIRPGTIVKVISRKTEKLRYKTENFLKVKLKDGRIRWVVDSYFHKMVFDSIPEINPDYIFPTTIETLQKNIIGDSLSVIENKYGPATSIFKTKKSQQLYYRHLRVFNGKYNHKGIIVLFNENDAADSIKYLDNGRGHFYNKIPLVKQLRGLELTKIFNYSFYVDNIPKLQWWEDFRNYSGWFTQSMAWVIKMGIFALLLFLFFSMGRMIAGPFMQIFTYTKLFGNSTVLTINFIIILLITYLLYVYIILIADQWFFIGLLAFGTTYFWYSIHSSTVEFDRCPACYTMYAAIDMGTTQDGISKTVSTEKVDHYVGTSVSHSGYNKVYTKNYLRLTKRTTDVYQNYTENRICKRCYHEWGVKLAKKIGSSSKYD